MTEDQKQAIKQNPIHWTAAECQEVCTQAKEQLTTEAYTAALADRAVSEQTDEGEQLLAAHQKAMQEIHALGEQAGGYLIWGYMALPAIERAVDADAWDAGGAVDFFTR